MVGFLIFTWWGEVFYAWTKIGIFGSFNCIEEVNRWVFCWIIIIFVGSNNGNTIFGEVSCIHCSTILIDDVMWRDSFW